MRIRMTVRRFATYGLLAAAVTAAATLGVPREVSYLVLLLVGR